MKCEFCGSSGKTIGHPCISCGKGAPTREPEDHERIRSTRGGGGARHYRVFGNKPKDN